MQFTSLRRGRGDAGQDIWTFILFNTLQCLWRSLQCSFPRLSSGTLYVHLIKKGKEAAIQDMRILSPRWHSLTLFHQPDHLRSSSAVAGALAASVPNQRSIWKTRADRLIPCRIEEGTGEPGLFCWRTALRAIRWRYLNVMLDHITHTGNKVSAEKREDLGGYKDEAESNWGGGHNHSCLSRTDNQT